VRYGGGIFKEVRNSSGEGKNHSHSLPERGLRKVNASGVGKEGEEDAENKKVDFQHHWERNTGVADRGLWGKKHCMLIKRER